MAALPDPDGDTVTLATKGSTLVAEKTLAEELKSADDISVEKALDVLLTYLEIKDRTYHTHTYRACFVASDAVVILIRHGLVYSLDKAISVCQQLKEEKYIVHVVDEDKDFAYEELFFRFTPKSRYGEVSDIGMRNDDGELLINDANLHRIKKLFASTLDIGTHRFPCRFTGHRYPNTFAASDAINCLVLSKQAKDTKDAIRLGRALVDAGFIESVVKDELHFEDSYKPFKLIKSTDDSRKGSVLLEADSLVDEWVREASRSLRRKTTGVDYVDFYTADTRTRRKLALQALVMLKDKMAVDDLSWRGVTYARCWRVADAINVMIQSTFAESKEEASLLGQFMVAEGHIIHVVETDKPFQLDEELFFRFVTPIGTDDSDFIRYSKLTDTERNEHIRKMCQAVKENVEVKDRKYHLKTYKQCFIASEAVSMLIDKKYVTCESEAIVECQRMVKAELIQHVVDAKKPFANDKLFFKFVEF